MSMPDHDPTPREMLIRFDSLVQQFSALARQMEQVVIRIESLQATLQSTYVPKETYSAHREADDRRFTDIEKDLEVQSGSRRQLVAGVILAVASAVISVLVAIVAARAGAGV